MATKATKFHAAWGKQHVKDGLCNRCSRPLATTRMCRYHADLYAAYERAAVKRKKKQRKVLTPRKR